LRVPGGDRSRVQAALDADGVVAALCVVPATFEETFVELARASDRPPSLPLDDSTSGRTAQ
jgi:hypothetical protein